MRITHIQRLKPSEFTEVFFRAIDPLRAARRLGPVLFQLPPAMKCDEALLGEFLATLPRDIRYAFEFRHDSWLTDPVYQLLEKYRCVAVPGGIGEAGGPAGDHGGFRLLAAADARVLGRGP